MIGGVQSLSHGLPKAIYSRLYSSLKDYHHSIKMMLLSSNSTSLQVGRVLISYVCLQVKDSFLQSVFIVPYFWWRVFTRWGLLASCFYDIEVGTIKTEEINKSFTLNTYSRMGYKCGGVAFAQYWS